MFACRRLHIQTQVCPRPSQRVPRSWLWVQHRGSALRKEALVVNAHELCFVRSPVQTWAYHVRKPAQTRGAGITPLARALRWSCACMSNRGKNVDLASCSWQLEEHRQLCSEFHPEVVVVQLDSIYSQKLPAHFLVAQAYVPCTDGFIDLGRGSSMLMRRSRLSQSSLRAI